jgi:hypothetical protein
MKYFKDVNNLVFAYENDGSQDSFISSSLIPITQDEATALSSQVYAKTLLSLNYAEKRSNEYPDFRDYLDGIVKGDNTQIQTYINACLAVKAKYPKL